jgi:hypothetical protein
MITATTPHPIHDTLLPFPGLHDIDGLCHVRVYERGGQPPVVIVGELDDNPGTKVRNGIEMVARAVQREFFADGTGFLLFERRPPLSENHEETFQLVDFSQEDSLGPHLSQVEAIEALAGAPARRWPPGRYTARSVGGLRGEYLRRQVAVRGRAAADRLIALLAEC